MPHGAPVRYRAALRVLRELKHPQQDEEVEEPEKNMFRGIYRMYRHHISYYGDT